MDYRSIVRGAMTYQIDGDIHSLAIGVCDGPDN